MVVWAINFEIGLDGKELPDGKTGISDELQFDCKITKVFCA